MLTVLMPVYNAENHLREAIESILGQTFGDFEFLIVDDGSSDSSEAIIRSYGDSRIRYLKNEKNLGIRETLNRGIANASWDLIARMDADDISYPNRLATQVAHMRKHPECDLVSSFARVVSEDGRYLYEKKPKGDEYYFNLTFGNWIQHPTVMYRKEAIEKVGGYSSFFCEDYTLWCRLIRECRFFTLEEVLLDYRVSDRSLSNSVRRTEYFEWEKRQIRENIAWFMGENYAVPDDYLECYRHNFDPIRIGGNVDRMVRCVREFDAIAKRIRETKNVNRNPRAIRRAARKKRTSMVAALASELPGRRKIALLVRLRAFACAIKQGKRALRRTMGRAPTVTVALSCAEEAPSVRESTPLVSVVIAFLNEERFLRDAVESVINQSYERWEAILVDDGSCDNSTEIAKAYAADFPGKIIYCQHDGHANRGLSASRNVGCGRAKGELIAILDADDVWLPEKLARQVEHFGEDPKIEMVADASEYWNNWDDPGKENRVRLVGAPQDRSFEPCELFPFLYPFGRGAAPCPCSIMFTKAAFKRSGGFEESFRGAYSLYEDQAFLSKIYLRERVYVSSVCSSLYRQHSGSMAKSVIASGHYDNVRLFFLEWFEKYLFENRIHEAEIDQLFKKAFLPYRSPWVFLIRHRAPRTARRLLRRRRYSGHVRGAI